MTAFPTKDVIIVAITGAAGQIGYSICPMIARGAMLGPSQRISLHLLDIEPALKALEGVRMELRDCAFPLLHDVVITADPAVAFKGADVAIFCGAFPRKDGMERKDLLSRNAAIFREQGAALRAHGEPHCRALVVGNPANTNALILARAVEGVIPRENITALTRLDHNRALSLAAEHLAVPVSTIRNVTIWGNHSSTQVPDVNNAKAGGVPLREQGSEQFWDETFIKQVQSRGAEVMKLRGLSSAASAAKAAVDHVHDWIVGTPEGTFVSMAIYSDGSHYGAPADVMFSFPVECRNGIYTVVTGLHVSDKVRRLMEISGNELVEERTQAGL